MSEFKKYAWPLRRAGFRKTWSTRAGGCRMDEWKHEGPDGRTLICQIWDDGQHRMSHEWLGCMDTHPTGFKTKDELAAAILRETTRVDSKYRDPNNHHAPGARDLLLSKQATSHPGKDGAGE